MTYSATVVGKTPIGVGETELRIYRIYRAMGLLVFSPVSSVQDGIYGLGKAHLRYTPSLRSASQCFAAPRHE